MSLQAIVNISNRMNIDRRKVVGVTETRNEIIRTTETPTRNPWRFNFATPNALRYSDARAVLEELDRLDRRAPATINFTSNPNLSWIFRYQGALSSAQINAITVTSFLGNQLILNFSAVTGISNSTILFRPNDIFTLLIDGVEQPYPFSVTQLYQGSQITSGLLTVTTHRANFITLGGTNRIRVGSSCNFRMLCTNMPTYTLVPGGYAIVEDTTVNNALIEFSEEFKFVEYLGDVN